MTMKLCEHPEFEQAILATTAWLNKPGLNSGIIEKDYYLTETLRNIANTMPLTQKKLF